jgi:hypothetical protein
MILGISGAMNSPFKHSPCSAVDQLYATLNTRAYLPES